MEAVPGTHRCNLRLYIGGIGEFQAFQQRVHLQLQYGVMAEYLVQMWYLTVIYTPLNFLFY